MGLSKSLTASSGLSICKRGAGKEVHPMLRYRDAEGSVLSQTIDRTGQTQTTYISKAAGSSPIGPATHPDQSDHEISSPATLPDSRDTASDSESEEEVASHLQRLQSLAGRWKQQHKPARATSAAPQLGMEEAASDGAQKGKDSFSPPSLPALPVYLHGIDEAKLQAALTASSLWHRIQLQDSLQVNTALASLERTLHACGRKRARCPVHPRVN